MKVVDVISSRTYGESQQIIAQVMNLLMRWLLSNTPSFIGSLLHSHSSMVRVAVCSQGDLADCFYIVESGQVRITMKRSRVGCKNDIVFFEDKSFSGVSYAILFLFLS